MSGIGVSVHADGLDGIINRLRRAKGRITGETSTAIDQTLGQMQRTVQEGTPVRTGVAQANWTIQRTGPLEGTLTNPIYYVIFLYLGTRYMMPSMLLNAAIQLARQQATQTMPTTLGARISTVLSKD